MVNPQALFQPKKEGLYCVPGRFYIDPFGPVERAIITHAHADHAKPGHQFVIGTPNTMDIMKIRFGEKSCGRFLPLDYEKSIRSYDTSIYLIPAGHILGSAQVVIDYQSNRFIFSGDYKRGFDPTCEPFKPEPCDIFITEATFGLPVFKHPNPEVEIKKLFDSMNAFPQRCHLIGVYPLGKCQRFIKLLRLSGFDETIYIHGALNACCQFYESQGISLGKLSLATSLDKAQSAGKIVLCPPNALEQRWNRRFLDPLLGMASGWMQIRARAKQRGIELPLVISDHADWPELIQTIKEVHPNRVYITHGREDALSYYANQLGYQTEALHLLGFEEEAD